MSAIRAPRNRKINPHEIVDLRVFQVSVKRGKKLRKMVEEFRRNVGLTMGIEVYEMENRRGLYRIEEHDGEITRVSGYIRVVGKQVWAGGFSDMVEDGLRARRIGYKMCPIDMSRGSVFGKDAKPVNLKGKVELTYAPKR
jgi:hypothetical protein